METKPLDLDNVQGNDTRGVREGLSSQVKEPQKKKWCARLYGGTDQRFYFTSLSQLTSSTVAGGSTSIAVSARCPSQYLRI